LGDWRYRHIIELVEAAEAALAKQHGPYKNKGRNMTDNDIYTLYENGKGRRYNLLFSVNTAAWAIFSYSVKNNAMYLSLEMFITSAMIAFTAIMFFDIWSFGTNMGNLGKSINVKLFGMPGRWVLWLICLLIAAMWAAVIVLGCTGNMLTTKP
jgi:hypothetical protein